jgi:hypothetical protein
MRSYSIRYGSVTREFDFAHTTMESLAMKLATIAATCILLPLSSLRVFGDMGSDLSEEFPVSDAVKTVAASAGAIRYVALLQTSHVEKKAAEDMQTEAAKLYTEIRRFDENHPVTQRARRVAEPPIEFPRCGLRSVTSHCEFLAFAGALFVVWDSGKKVWAYVSNETTPKLVTQWPDPKALGPSKPRLFRSQEQP